MSRGAPPPTQLQSLRFFTHVFRNLGVAAVLADLEGQISHVNPEAERLLGWGPGELVGHPVSDLLGYGQTPVLLPQVEAAGGTWLGAVESRRRSGAVFPTFLTVSIMRDDAGNRLALLGLLSDQSAAVRRRARLRSLASLCAALNADGGLAPLLARLCKETREHFAADGVYLFRLDETTAELIGMVGNGPLSEEVSHRRIVLAGHDDPLSIAVHRREPTIARDSGPESRYSRLTEGLEARSTLLVPLVCGDRVLGLLVLMNSGHSDTFAEDADLVRAFGEYAAVALEDARLHEAQRTTSERLRVLIRIGQVLTSSLDRTVVFATIASGARELLGVEAIRLWLLETSDGPFRLEYFHPAIGVRHPEIEFAGSHMGDVVRSGQPWQTRDVHTDPEVARKPWYCSTMQAGLRGCLMVPLIARGGQLGVLSLLSADERSFSPEDVQLAVAFGNQAATAVHNAETLARERQAQRLEQLLQRADQADPADLALVNRLLGVAERLVDENGAESAPADDGAF